MVAPARHGGDCTGVPAGGQCWVCSWPQGRWQRMLCAGRAVPRWEMYVLWAAAFGVGIPQRGGVSGTNMWRVCQCSVGTVAGTRVGLGPGRARGSSGGGMLLLCLGLGKGLRFAHPSHVCRHQAPCQLRPFP